MSFRCSVPLLKGEISPFSGPSIIFLAVKLGLMANVSSAPSTTSLMITKSVVKSPLTAKSSTELLVSAKPATLATKSTMANVFLLNLLSLSTKAAKASKTASARSAPSGGTSTQTMSASLSTTIVGNGKIMAFAPPAIWVTN